MSRIGKLPVAVPDGVTISVTDGIISATGPKGTLAEKLPPRVAISQENGQVLIQPTSRDRIARSMHGLARSLINNVVEGVTKGFSRTLEINGVGYRVEKKKEYLVFTLGYSHPIYYELPEGVDANIENPTKLTLLSMSRQRLGAAAAKIRSFRPPEPYKGKGIKYADEVLRRKEGKSGGR